MKDRESEQHVTAEQVRQVMDVLHPCMDDYLYVLDIKHDYYSIAPGAQKRFRMEKAEFSHATEKFRERYAVQGSGADRERTEGVS